MWVVSLLGHIYRKVFIGERSIKLKFLFPNIVSFNLKMANFGFFQVLSIKKAWKKYLTVLKMYLQERKRSKMFHVSFFFYWEAFVNAVNLYSLGRAKGEKKKRQLEKKSIFFSTCTCWCYWNSPCKRQENWSKLWVKNFRERS